MRALCLGLLLLVGCVSVEHHIVLVDQRMVNRPMSDQPTRGKCVRCHRAFLFPSGIRGTVVELEEK